MTCRQFWVKMRIKLFFNAFSPFLRVTLFAYTLTFSLQSFLFSTQKTNLYSLHHHVSRRHKISIRQKTIQTDVVCSQIHITVSSTHILDPKHFFVPTFYLFVPRKSAKRLIIRETTKCRQRNNCLFRALFSCLLLRWT